MNKKDTTHMAYCGFDCAKCPVYKATEAKDEKFKSKLAKEYSVGGYSFTAKDMNCLGCKSDTISEKMCSTCQIRICAKDKNINDTCAFCNDFPCETINNLLPTGEGTRDYLDELNKEWIQKNKN